ncbi:MAG: SRPBCC family protein [Candidatus Limnocylindrales bacterium]
MDAHHSVELQAEVHAARDSVWPLLSTPEGLCRWLDGADFEARVGAPVRLRLDNAVATGTVLAVDPPQHVSFSFDWADEPLGRPTVVALDAIDHGEGTHLTLRHVGLPGGRERERHAVLWKHWFSRLVREAAAARWSTGSQAATPHPGGS